MKPEELDLDVVLEEYLATCNPKKLYLEPDADEWAEKYAEALIARCKQQDERIRELEYAVKEKDEELARWDKAWEKNNWG